MPRVGPVWNYVGWDTRPVSISMTFDREIVSNVNTTVDHWARWDKYNNPDREMTISLFLSGALQGMGEIRHILRVRASIHPTILVQ